MKKGNMNLADVCRDYELLLMNFATGCIFEYNDAHPGGSGIGFKETGAFTICMTTNSRS